MALTDIYQAVLTFRLNEIGTLVRTEINEGTDIDNILNDGLIAAMDEVGQRYSQEEFFVPEMLQAAKTMKSGLEVLRPFLVDGRSRQRGMVVIGTVKGDLHDIGKNLVSMMLEGAGFQTVNLGVGVMAEAFIAAAHENDPDIIALSALLTTTMPQMQKTIEQLKDAGFEGKIMVGGAPVTERYAVKIGADGYAADAADAVQLARQLVRKD